MFEEFEEYPQIQKDLTETCSALSSGYGNIAAGIMCRCAISLIANIYTGLSKDMSVTTEDAVYILYDAGIISQSSRNHFLYFDSYNTRMRHGVANVEMEEVYLMFSALIGEAYLYAKHYALDNGPKSRRRTANALRVFRRKKKGDRRDKRRQGRRRQEKETEGETNEKGDRRRR